MARRRRCRSARRRIAPWCLAVPWRGDGQWFTPVPRCRVSTQRRRLGRQFPLRFAPANRSRPLISRVPVQRLPIGLRAVSGGIARPAACPSAEGGRQSRRPRDTALLARDPSAEQHAFRPQLLRRPAGENGRNRMYVLLLEKSWPSRPSRSPPMCPTPSGQALTDRTLELRQTISRVACTIGIVRHIDDIDERSSIRTDSPDAPALVVSSCAVVVAPEARRWLSWSTTRRKLPRFGRVRRSGIPGPERRPSVVDLCSCLDVIQERWWSSELPADAFGSAFEARAPKRHLPTPE